MSLTLTIDKHLATIVMDDGKVNALDNNWFRTMLGLLDEVEASDAHALILMGRKGIYSGGLNVKWLPTMDASEQTAFGQLFPGTLNRLYRFPKPTIAAVTGHAIAGGCLLACACDRRLAVSGDYNMAMNEVLINMTIPYWAINIIMDVIPKPKVNDVLNHAEFLSFEILHDMGVFRSLHPSPEALLEAATDLAADYDKISLRDFAATKHQVRPL